MADEKPWVPDPPAGLHGPTADAPGSILDPTMRKAIREVLTPALVETFRYLAGEIAKGNVTQPPNVPMPQMPPMPGTPPMPGGGAAQQPAGAASQPATAPTNGMPYPHGDMDLSGFVPANVVQPNAPRTGQDRQFYFLKKPNVPGGG